MNCPLETRQRAELLVAYSSRKLDAASTALVEKHMESCDACREVVRGQRALWEALDRWEAEPVSDDFDRRLYRRIEAQVTWWQRLTGRLNPLVLHSGVPLAVAAVLMLIVGAVLDRSAAPPPNPPASEIAAVESLQPEQVVNALDEMLELTRFNDLMKPEAPQSKM